MKNKKNIKILLPVVLLIWGLLLYKLFEVLFPDESIPIATVTSEFKIPTYQEKDTFSLRPITRDPFLDILARGNQNATRKNSKKENSTPWPTIKYHGSVVDKKGRSSIFIVSIDGEQQLLKKGASFSEVKLLNGSGTEVVLSHKGHSRKFSLQ